MENLRGYLEFAEDKEKGIVPHSMGVYGIAVNGKIKYVGSSLDMFKRKSNHLANLRGNKHNNNELQELYNEHGEDAFTFTILMQGFNKGDEKNLYDYERFCMQYFRKTILNYNDVVSDKKHIRSKEERKRIRERLSEINSGEGNPNNRLTKEDAKEIIKLKKKGVKYKDIADKFGISESHINKIGKTRWLSIV
ncbi:MAG: hypothetical protein M0Q88_08435 [Bacilli bacterium]|nr:hypothetical protein [Bacilli bacterium]